MKNFDILPTTKFFDSSLGVSKPWHVVSNYKRIEPTQNNDEPVKICGRQKDL